MAVKKIQIIPEGSNDYADILHPETSVDMVVGLDRFGTASGTNSYVVTIADTTLSEGKRITVKFTNANTGASTLNVNGQGAKAITKAGGTALSTGNIKAGGIYSLVYDGTSFQLQGEGGEYGTAQINHVLSPYTIGTEEGIKTGTMVNRGKITHSLSINSSFTIPQGYHDGTGVVNQSITNHGAKTFTPTDATQTSGAGYYSSITVNARPTLSGNATTAQVLSGRLYYGSTYTKQTGTMTNRGAVTKTLTTQGGSYTIPSGYHSGSGKVTASFSNLSAANIKKGVNIGGVVGNLVSVSDLQNKLFAVEDIVYPDVKKESTTFTGTYVGMIIFMYWRNDTGAPDGFSEQAFTFGDSFSSIEKSMATTVTRSGNTVTINIKKQLYGGIRSCYVYIMYV